MFTLPTATSSRSTRLISSSSNPNPSISRQLMSSRPESPIKQTFKKLLSPNKSKPASTQPALTPQLPEHTNWTYPESTSSSNFSADSNTQYNTGWNVLESPRTPASGANKENVMSTKDVVEKVMGPSKLSKQKSKQLSKSADLDRQFEELMVYHSYVTC